MGVTLGKIVDVRSEPLSGTTDAPAVAVVAAAVAAAPPVRPRIQTPEKLRRVTFVFLDMVAPVVMVTQIIDMEAREAKTVIAVTSTVCRPVRAVVAARMVAWAKTDMSIG